VRAAAAVAAVVLLSHGLFGPLVALWPCHPWADERRFAYAVAAKQRRRLKMTSSLMMP